MSSPERYDELRGKIRKISLIDPILLEEILTEIVDEIEELAEELHQGFTKIK